MYTVTLQTEANNSNNAQIAFSGELLIDSMEGIVAETKELLGDYASYKIQAVDVEDIDLSFIQFVHSLALELKTKNKTISLDIQIPETISDLLKNTGIGKVLTR